jgi:hypothetical protein
MGILGGAIYDFKHVIATQRSQVDSIRCFTAKTMAKKKTLHGAKLGLTNTSLSGSSLPQTRPSSSKSGSKTSSPKASFLPRPSVASSSSMEHPHEMPYSPMVSSLAPVASEKLSPDSKKAIDTFSQELKRVRSRDEKLKHRFYEPLVLLFTLGSTRGDPAPDDVVTEITSLSSRDARRKFLTALAYACDYDKGGDTVTAIGLEHIPEVNVFWVASNNNPTHEIVPFLRKLLTKLACNAMDEEALEEDISRICIEFATPRIKKYQKLICQIMKKGRLTLRRVESTYRFCHFAIKIRIVPNHSRHGPYDLARLFHVL